MMKHTSRGIDYPLINPMKSPLRCKKGRMRGPFNDSDPIAKIWGLARTQLMKAWIRMKMPVNLLPLRPSSSKTATI